MPRRGHRALEALLACVALWAPSQLAAADDRFGEQLARVVDAAWNRAASPDAALEADYQQAKRLAITDPRGPFVWAVVHIKHRKYAEASKLLAESAQLDAHYLPAREAIIWVELLLKRHESALAQMKELSRMLFAPSARSGPLDETNQRDAARFLGRAAAYLAGPGKSTTQHYDVARYKETMLTLPEELRAEFLSGFGAVDARIAELGQTQEATRQETKAEQVKLQMSESQRLAEERDRVSEEAKQVAEQAAANREDLERSLREIESQLIPLAAEYARLDAEAASIRGQVAGLDGTIARMLANCQANCKRDSNGQTNCTCGQEVGRLDALKSVLVGEFAGVEQSAGRVSAQANGLNFERDRLIGDYNQEAKRLGHEQVTLGKKDRRFQRQQQTNTKTPTGNSAKTRSVSEKTHAFTSYIPFPLENAKTCALQKPAESLDPYRAVLMSIGRLPEDSRYRLAGQGQVTSRDSVLILQSGQKQGTRLWGE